jgi:putative ABC transport system permease protein
MSLSAITSGLRRLFRKDAVERDLDDEVRQYVELATQQHMRSGLSREAAERAARIEFGGVETTKELVRSSGWDASVETLFRDVRYAARGLRRYPAFTAVVLLTLALGIGVNTAMFSVVNAVMLRPLPYHDARRLALIWTDDTRRGLHQEGTGFPTVLDWRRDNRTFSDIAFFNTGRTTLSENGTRERTRSALVSANLFPVLGVAPLFGRAITASDESDAERVAVISYSLWQRRFASDPKAVGRTIEVEENGSKDGSAAVTVIGVMPPAFFFPDRQTELWTPATTYWRFQRESRERFSPWARRWTAIGRLRPDVSIRDARSDLTRIADRLSVIYRSDVPDFPGFAANVVPMLDYVAGKNIQTALWVLLGAVGLVLLVACANIANLLLARGAARQQEFAVRRALGASRGRLIRQLVAESMLLATAGGLAGVVLATVGTRALAVLAADRIPRVEGIAVDMRVLGFAAVISLVAGLVFGLVPALGMSRTDASETLKAGRHAGGSVQTRRMRGLLIVAECALAIVLLAGAGLLLKSLQRLKSVEPGFDPSHVLMVRMEFPPEAPPAAEERTQTSRIEPERARGREQRVRDLTARLASIPGVDHVGFVDDMFVTGQANKSITILGRAIDSLEAGELNDGAVTPGFFETMHVPLRRGRLLTNDDAVTKIRALWSTVVTDMSLADKEQRATAEPVVVNEAFVHRFFANEDPLGKRFCIDPTNKTYWYVIVGVVGDMHRQGLEKRAIPEYFGSYVPSPRGRADLVVRTRRDAPLSLAPDVRRVVAAVVPNVLIGRISTVDDQLGDFSAARDFQTWLLSVFALLALGLAAVGIFGVVQYAVAERTREIGLRIALGATPADVRRLIVAQGMRTPALGIAMGLIASLWVTRLMSRLLFDIGATDPETFTTVALVLLGVASAACYVPARRASGVDVVTALRQE